MTTPTPPPTSAADRYVTLRWLRWLVQPQRLRIYLCGLLTLATLVALFYGVTNWRGRRAWDRERAALQAARVPVTLTELVPAPVPDDQNFAQTPFLAPLFDFRPGTQQHRDTNGVERARSVSVPSASRQGGWPLAEFTDFGVCATLMKLETNTNDPAASVQAVRAALDRFGPVLDELRTASRRPHARFSVRYEEEAPPSILLPHLSVVRNIAQVYTLRASAELALGRTETALEDVGMVFYLMDTIREEPVLISYLVRCALLHRSLDPIWEGLARRQWSEPQLAELQKRLEGVDLWQDSRRALDGERAWGNATVEFLRRHPAELPRFGAVPGTEGEDVGGGLDALLIWLAPRGWFYFEQVEYNRLFTLVAVPESSLAARFLDPGTFEVAGKQLDAALRPSWRALLRHRVLAGLLLPALGAVHEKTARCQVGADLAALACALERCRLARGAFPDSLEALRPQWFRELRKDIVRGGPLVYRRETDNAFVLYSIGWNGLDDGGVPAKTRRGGWDAKEGDWVWKCPARP